MELDNLANNIKRTFLIFWDPTNDYVWEVLIPFILKQAVNYRSPEVLQDYCEITARLLKITVRLLQITARLILDMVRLKQDNCKMTTK